MLSICNMKCIQHVLFRVTWIALTLSAFAFVQRSYADEVASDMLALGPVEDEICGINFEQDSIKDVLRKLGKPTSKNQTEMDYDNYIWKKGTLTITIESDPSSGPAITSIEVYGSDPTGFCLTKHGIKLGDKFSTVVNSYGRVGDDPKDNANQPKPDPEHEGKYYSGAQWAIKNGAYQNILYVEMRFSSSLHLENIFMHEDLE